MRASPLVCATACLALVIPVQSATAAERLGRAGQNDMVRDAATSKAGRSVDLKINRRGRVTFDATFRNIVRADNVLAVRSSIAPKWGMLAVAAAGNSGYQRTFLLKRQRGKWKALFAASRGSENLAICKLRKPPTAVALDLGFSDAGTWGERCKHKRKRSSLVRRMTAAELSSVRRMVEWRWTGAVHRPGPVQPRFTDSGVSNSDCLWDGGHLVNRARGEVARANPRWGAVDVGCRTPQGYNVTQYLVKRSSRTGAFTAVPAHVLPSWSSYASACQTNRKWPIPAASRVALEFCAPFPSIIASVFR